MADSDSSPANSASTLRQSELRATYNSPSAPPHTISRPLNLSFAPDCSPSEASAHLARLGGEAAKLQEEINTFLTAQMGLHKAGDVREVEEEKNYGEEADDDE